jgi:hypothetical protein
MHDNSLSPIGRALWIWNRFLGDEMVATVSSEHIRCFASRKAGRQIALFFLNKDTSTRRASVALQHLPEEFTQGEQWVFHGSGPSDRNPTWTRQLHQRCGSQITLPLDPVSVTVILLIPEQSHGVLPPALLPRDHVADSRLAFHRGDIAAPDP